MTRSMAGEEPDVALADPPGNPWRALWAMMVGFFMILVDSTIVAVANPSIMDALEITDYDSVIWVTSSYLLAYAVPLLLAGRLGDRYGPKYLYLAGLALFTLSSLWCGLSGSIEMLIVARAVQGLGAALLTPQTLSTITRIFPPQHRGVAMSVWGATAGVATLVGPLAGGVLVDHLGWEWIFFVNVPVGVIGLGLAVWLVPTMPTNKHRFDLLGVALSGMGMFLVVFGLQEGQSHHWAAWIWAVIVAGIGCFAAFVYWQSVNRNEPLIPLEIFADRDFSLSNLGVAVIGFVVTAMVLPVMFYAQVVCGLTPTRSALLVAPMAVASGVLAPLVGRIVDSTHPRSIIGFGFSVLAIALTWLSIEMAPATPIWRLVLPLTAMGVGMAFIWAPLATTATRNLPPRLAGAGSGVYNATRQVGSVLGSAGMAALMAARINDELPAAPADTPVSDLAVLKLPAFLHAPFAAALSQSVLLPAFVALFGILAALFMIGGLGRRVEGPSLAGAEEITDRFPAYYDDDDYLEYEVDRERVLSRVPEVVDDETEQIVWRRPEPEPAVPVMATAEPIGFAHNGFHVDEDHFAPLDSVRPTFTEVFAEDDEPATVAEDFPLWTVPETAASDNPEPLSRHRLTDEGEPRRARHYRDESEDTETYGRHSMRRD